MALLLLCVKKAYVKVKLSNVICGSETWWEISGTWDQQENTTCFLLCISIATLLSKDRMATEKTSSKVKLEGPHEDVYNQRKRTGKRKECSPLWKQ